MGAKPNLLSNLRTVSEDFTKREDHLSIDQAIGSLTVLFTKNEIHQKQTIGAMTTYLKIKELASKSHAFDTVLLSAKTNALEKLQQWIEKEYSLLTERLNDRQMDLEESISMNIQDSVWSKQTLLDEFIATQGTGPWSEEDEIIKILTWFNLVHRSACRPNPLNRAEIICDIAHPCSRLEILHEEKEVFQFLDDLADKTEYLLNYMKVLEEHPNLTTEDAKELLRLRAMDVWKSVRCFKLVAFTSDVLTEMMNMPVYTGEDIWTHQTGEEWPLGLRLRDSPIVETITIGMIVIIGLLCASAPLSKILWTPDTVASHRAIQLLLQYRTKYHP